MMIDRRSCNRKHHNFAGCEACFVRVLGVMFFDPIIKVIVGVGLVICFWYNPMSCCKGRIEIAKTRSKTASSIGGAGHGRHGPNSTDLCGELLLEVIKNVSFIIDLSQLLAIKVLTRVLVVLYSLLGVPCTVKFS